MSETRDYSPTTSATSYPEPRSIAVISGKGGSGKTMLAAEMGRIFAVEGSRVLICDADTGTGGMTFYLGLKLVQNTAVGLSTFLAQSSDKPNYKTLATCLQPILFRGDAAFFGVGDFRRLFNRRVEPKLPARISDCLKELKKTGRWMIVDCRGGIDRESLAVCEVIDDIIIIVESDTTSFQATQHVVQVLAENDLAGKLRGFIINKVFDDPTAVIRNGTAVFRCQCLGTIPFDLKASRAFLVGDVPDERSLVGIHVNEALRRGFPGAVGPPKGTPWTAHDFREVGMTNLDSLRGGFVIVGFICLLATYLLSEWRKSGSECREFLFLSLTFMFLGLLGCLEPTRRLVGRAVDGYTRLFSRILSGDLPYFRIRRPAFRGLENPPNEDSDRRS